MQLSPLSHKPSPPPFPGSPSFPGSLWPPLNLDVTTMCALVSEVCHGGPANPAVVAW